MHDLRVMCRVGMFFEYAVPDAECNIEARWSEFSLDRERFCRKREKADKLINICYCRHRPEAGANS